MSYELRSNGQWLNQIGPYFLTSVTWKWGDGGGGLGEVTFEMDVPYDYDHPCLRRGARVELMDGGIPVGVGLLAEPGRTETGLAFTVPGIYREAEHFLCLTSAGDSTSVADTAIDVTVATYGLQWSRNESISPFPLKTGDTTQGLNYLNDLLNSVADELGKRWWVDGYGAVHMTADPTIPTWVLRPGLVNPGVADDDFANVLIGRYISGTTYVSKTATDTVSAARFGTRMYAVDMSALGSISATRATNRLTGLLAKGKARLSFTDRISATPFDLFTAGGQPAPLSMVRAGDLVRAYGLDGDAAILNGANYIDFVLGEVVDAQDGTLSLAPVGLAARSLADAFAVVPSTRSFAT